RSGKLHQGVRRIAKRLARQLEVALVLLDDSSGVIGVRVDAPDLDTPRSEPFVQPPKFRRVTVADRAGAADEEQKDCLCVRRLQRIDRAARKVERGRRLRAAAAGEEYGDRNREPAYLPRVSPRESPSNRTHFANDRGRNEGCDLAPPSE